MKPYTQEQLARIYGGYIGAEVYHKHFHVSGILNSVSQSSASVKYAYEGSQPILFSDLAVLLTPLEKITEDDAMKLMESHIDFCVGGPIIQYVTVSHSVISIDYFFAFNQNQTYFIPDLTYKQAKVLKELGYDVDGLIASGIAIDRTTLNKGNVLVKGSEINFVV